MKKKINVLSEMVSVEIKVDNSISDLSKILPFHFKYKKDKETMASILYQLKSAQENIKKLKMRIQNQDILSSFYNPK